jgi:hypothetical protein
MPVLKSITSYRLKNGKHRTVRLYRAWCNMQARIKGTTHAGNGAKPWLGLQCTFWDFAHFREWALTNGYSRVLNSLDRIRAWEGYGPDNCRWTTRAQNTSYMNAARLIMPIAQVNAQSIPF